jgi:hypothetical protein
VNERRAIAIAAVVARKARDRQLRQQFKAARDIGLGRRHRNKEKNMEAKATRDPFGPFLNGFTFDQAYDGNTWIIKKGEHFADTPAVIASKLREEHERRVGRLEVKYEGDTVHVRFVPSAR